MCRRGMYWHVVRFRETQSLDLIKPFNMVHVHSKEFFGVFFFSSVSDKMMWYFFQWCRKERAKDKRLSFFFRVGWGFILKFLVEILRAPQKKKKFQWLKIMCNNEVWRDWIGESPLGYKICLWGPKGLGNFHDHYKMKNSSHYSCTQNPNKKKTYSEYEYMVICIYRTFKQSRELLNTCLSSP